MIKRLFFAAIAFVIFSRTYGEPKSDTQVTRLQQVNALQSDYNNKEKEEKLRLEQLDPSTSKEEKQTETPR